MVPADPFKIYRKWDGVWVCDGCGASPKEQSLMFHCHMCNYDLCSACYFGLEEDHPDHEDTFHAASRVDRCLPTWTCDVCRTAVDFAFTCSTCETPFVLCKTCFFQIHNPDVHKHRLDICDASAVYANQKGHWHCDICGGGGKHKSQMFHCRKCSEFDVCFDCMFEGIDTPWALKQP